MPCGRRRRLSLACSLFQFQRLCGIFCSTLAGTSCFQAHGSSWRFGRAPSRAAVGGRMTACTFVALFLGRHALGARPRELPSLAIVQRRSRSWGSAGHKQVVCLRQGRRHFGLARQGHNGCQSYEEIEDPQQILMRPCCDATDSQHCRAFTFDDIGSIVRIMFRLRSVESLVNVGMCRVACMSCGGSRECRARSIV